VLANLFMHYAFDLWLSREFPGCPFERYADLCRGRHKSAYAEVRVMPTLVLEGPPGGRVTVMGAA
jgi:RNA-directed DNA polymerase